MSRTLPALTLPDAWSCVYCPLPDQSLDRVRAASRGARVLLLQRHQHDVAELDRRPFGLQADCAFGHGTVRRLVHQFVVNLYPDGVPLAGDLQSVPLTDGLLGVV